MSIVLGVAASHTTLMNTHWDAVAHLDGAVGFRDALAHVNEMLVAAQPDVVVIVGPNHFRGLWLDLMPAFLIGVGSVDAAGEHGTPKGPLLGDPAFAHSMLEALVDDEFDIAFSAALTIDHGITHAVQYMLSDVPAPIVPVLVNAFAPPLPRLARCVAFGRALGRALAATDRRVALIASGGLSHALAFPDWRSPANADEEFLVTSWLEGRGRWEEFEARRRGIVVGGAPRLAPEFDRAFLDAAEQGALEQWAAEPNRDRTLPLEAGNGGNEVRTWLILAAACGHAPVRVLSYAPVPEWKTGMAVAVVEAPRNGDEP
ncbi:MAG: catechol 1,2-dioxygenase [Acidimicrobiia bacterium]